MLLHKPRAMHCAHCPDGRWSDQKEGDTWCKLKRQGRRWSCLSIKIVTYWIFSTLLRIYWMSYFLKDTSLSIIGFTPYWDVRAPKRHREGWLSVSSPVSAPHASGGGVCVSKNLQPFLCSWLPSSQNTSQNSSSEQRGLVPHLYGKDWM